jgi:hypothetical protein
MSDLGSVTGYNYKSEFTTVFLSLNLIGTEPSAQKKWKNKDCLTSGVDLIKPHFVKFSWYIKK